MICSADRPWQDRRVPLHCPGEDSDSQMDSYMLALETQEHWGENERKEAENTNMAWQTLGFKETSRTLRQNRYGEVVMF